MRTYRIRFSADNINLYGEFFLPDVLKKQSPAVCLCHGIPAVVYNPDERGWATVAERFCEAGFVSMIFNFRGSGLSEGNFDMMGWTRDLTAAIDRLYHLKEVDKQKIYLLGSSGGAAAGIYTVAHDNRIAAVATLACPATFGFVKDKNIESVLDHFRDIGIIKDNNFPASLQEWLNGFDIVAPLKWIKKISPRPLLLIHGEKDDIVPVKQAEKLYKQAHEPKKLVIIEDAGHRLRLEERAVSAALTWLQEIAELTPIQ
jgi:dipeptidyl aminopeptidase/acylaminoacyl peptidase